jgi:hypothetical protein
MYDMLADKLLVWSSDYKDGNDFLFEGVKVQVGALDLAVDLEERRRGRTKGTKDAQHGGCSGGSRDRASAPAA